MKKVAGGVTVAKGFKAAGQHVGLKRKRKDLAILMSEVPATVAGVFTTNVVKGAPVTWSHKVVSAGTPIKAVVINSGHANSCTGPQGDIDCVKMAEATALALGCAAEEVAVASTGYIGVQLPIDKICAGIPIVAGLLAATEEGGTAAAEAIRTTDLFTKQIAFQLDIDGTKVMIGGMAKGSGMVHPNMATMLAFVTTDINITQELLSLAMKESVCTTYNMISVDGDTSTNDMALVFANGLAGNKLIESADDKNFIIFKTALHTVNELLAKAVARDGEGATKFLEVSVIGSESREDAQKLAKSVVSSSLVKTALFGEDANWGRIIAALGRGGVNFDPSKLSISFDSDAGHLPLMCKGKPLVVNTNDAHKVLSEKDIRISIDMVAGGSEARAWGCDLSYDYVRINGAYRT
ncbi:MAG: bifunctional glutamate N-acetyltransferase/amino-acid acetyltransferase ArgJ [Candidatus Melainabacteria bacterium]|nr:bifunctional glutamate N-acetyltransferase/amino-acid acetyltransferase ArgJ [Candidatus Melainabacteria bacterium]